MPAPLKISSSDSSSLTLGELMIINQILQHAFKSINPKSEIGE